MLFTATVEGPTLQLLRELCREDMLRQFNLVGGTALSLQLGHRKSVDLEFFSSERFDAVDMDAWLASAYGFQTLFQGRNSLMGVVDGVKLDIISYPYPLLDPLVLEDGLRLCGLQDIAAMKLSAITQNGTRLKDFVDVAFLSTQMSFSRMLDAYEAKYLGSSRLSPMKALTYFTDIDFAQTVMMMRGDLDWKAVSQRLTHMTEEPDRKFRKVPLISGGQVRHGATLWRST